MHRLKIEVTKFTLVGAANFVVTFVVFTMMLKLMSINYLLSLSVAWLLGLCLSYALNLLWVFKPGQKIRFKARFLKFFLASVVSIVLNMLILAFIVERSDADPHYVQLALIPPVVVFNF